MMRLMALDPEQAEGRLRDLLGGVLAGEGRISNMIRTLSNSPAVLEGYLAFRGALAKGRLEPRLREAVALAVAEANGSEYCLASHAQAGESAGLSAIEGEDARRGDAAEAKLRAALRFGRRLIELRGAVPAADVAGLKAIGFTPGEIAELVANVALSVFTNYFNRAAGTEVDSVLPGGAYKASRREEG